MHSVRRAPGTSETIVATKIEIIGHWLYRRYATKGVDRPWNLLGGRVKHSWLNDAQGILDAVSAWEEELEDAER
jgi:hypothetical protein